MTLRARDQDLPEVKEMTTADDLSVALCTLDGGDHDWREYEHTAFTALKVSMRCIWCHALMCGDASEDPMTRCCEPYHHKGNHRNRLGQTWRLGGDRPQVAS